MIKELLTRVREYKWKTLVTPLLMIGEVAMEVFIPFIMANIIDIGIATMDMSYIIKMSLVLIGCALLALMFGTLGARIGSFAASGFATNLRHDLFSKVQDFSFSDIDHFSSSSLVTRLTTDVQRVQNLFSMSIRMFVRSPMMLIFASIMAAKAGGKLALIFVAVIPVLVVGVLLMMGAPQRYMRAAFEGLDSFNGIVDENLTGIRTVKAYVREDEEKRKFDSAADNVKKNYKKAQHFMVLMDPLVMTISYTIMIIISYFGAKLVNVGHMDTGSLMSLYTYSMQILSSLMMTASIVIIYAMTRPSIERISEVLTHSPSMDRNEGGITKVENGDIEFRNVNFGYKEGSSVLKDINLKINSGEMVGIMGTTGSGKTTLISLIARLYDTSSGEVLVGGKNVKDYNLTSLRDGVSVVLQKNTLFSGTVEDNLKWGNENGSESDMERTTSIASALSFINEKEDGFNSRVEQGGSNFSGGQKQRLCIARALMKNPKILIMDDSTSAVDTATDRKIRKSLRENVNGMTRIIISQRISSIEDADKIIIMDNGRITDVGTHDELLLRNEGYRDLFETQSKGVAING